VDAGEVVMHEVERDRVAKVVNFLRESIRQAREPAHAHAHREILALDVARGNMLCVGTAGDSFPCRSSANGRAVAFLCFRLVPVMLDKHRVVNVRAESILNCG